MYHVTAVDGGVLYWYEVCNLYNMHVGSRSQIDAVIILLCKYSVRTGHLLIVHKNNKNNVCNRKGKLRFASKIINCSGVVILKLV